MMAVMHGLLEGGEKGDTSVAPTGARGQALWDRIARRTSFAGTDVWRRVSATARWKVDVKKLSLCAACAAGVWFERLRRA
jgi:hypothetical protein